MYTCKKIILILLIILILFIFIYGYSGQLKIILINYLVVLRGILAPNCLWYHISDLLLNDGDWCKFI